MGLVRSLKLPVVGKSCVGIILPFIFLQVSKTKIDENKDTDEQRRKKIDDRYDTFTESKQSQR